MFSAEQRLGIAGCFAIAEHYLLASELELHWHTSRYVSVLVVIQEGFICAVVSCTLPFGLFTLLRRGAGQGTSDHVGWSLHHLSDFLVCRCAPSSETYMDGGVAPRSSLLSNPPPTHPTRFMRHLVFTIILPGETRQAVVGGLAEAHVVSLQLWHQLGCHFPAHSSVKHRLSVLSIFRPSNTAFNHTHRLTMESTDIPPFRIAHIEEASQIQVSFYTSHS